MVPDFDSSCSTVSEPQIAENRRSSIKSRDDPYSAVKTKVLHSHILACKWCEAEDVYLNAMNIFVYTYPMTKQTGCSSADISNKC